MEVSRQQYPYFCVLYWYNRVEYSLRTYISRNPSFAAPLSTPLSSQTCGRNIEHLTPASNNHGSAKDTCELIDSENSAGACQSQRARHITQLLWPSVTTLHHLQPGEHLIISPTIKNKVHRDQRKRLAPPHRVAAVASPWNAMFMHHAQHQAPTCNRIGRIRQEAKGMIIPLVPGQASKRSRSKSPQGGRLQGT